MRGFWFSIRLSFRWVDHRKGDEGNAKKSFPERSKNPFSVGVRFCMTYTPGGTKRQIKSMSPESCRRMQTCMRLSFDSRTGKSNGTLTLPCFDATIICGLPPPAGTSRTMFSTGAQSMSLQQSFGYQSCPFAGARAAMPTKTGRATRAERMILMRLPRASLGMKPLAEADAFMRALMVYARVDHGPPVGVVKLPSSLAEICLKSRKRAVRLAIRSMVMMHKWLRFDSFTLDLERLRLDGPSGQADLRRKSFDVLRYLVEHAGSVVTKEELIKGCLARRDGQ